MISRKMKCLEKYEIESKKKENPKVFCSAGGILRTPQWHEFNKSKFSAVTKYCARARTTCVFLQNIVNFAKHLTWFSFKEIGYIIHNIRPAALMRSNKGQSHLDKNRGRRQVWRILVRPTMIKIYQSFQVRAESLETSYTCSLKMWLKNLF